MDFEKIWTNENINFTRRILNKLEDDPYLPEILGFIDARIVNIWSVLAYLAKSLKVNRYAELGVRRGFSMAIVGARRKQAHLTGFDLWQPGYGGAPNPGPDFVRAELKKVGHTGTVELIGGDCANTVPVYDGDYFDLVLVDAEHTEEGQLRDINNALGLLEKGGWLVVDDLQDEAVFRGWCKAIDDISMDHWVADRVGIIRGADKR